MNVNYYFSSRHVIKTFKVSSSSQYTLYIEKYLLSFLFNYLTHFFHLENYDISLSSFHENISCGAVQGSHLSLLTVSLLVVAFVVC